VNVLIYLVPIALGLGLTGLAGFLWSLRSGQYDDLEGASLRILSNDDLRQPGPHVAKQRVQTSSHPPDGRFLR